MTTTENSAQRAAETGTRSRQARAERAAAVIEELTRQRAGLTPVAQLAPDESAGGQMRRALIAARLAGWWLVLARTTAWGEVPPVFMAAAYLAHRAEQDHARRALESARFWANRVAETQASVSGPVR